MYDIPRLVKYIACFGLSAHKIELKLPDTRSRAYPCRSATMPAMSVGRNRRRKSFPNVPNISRIEQEKCLEKGGFDLPCLGAVELLNITAIEDRK